MAVKDAIQYMGNRVDQLVVCCSSAARQSCECGWSFDGIRDFMKNREFFEISASILPVENQSDTSCICWNEIETDVVEFVLDSGKVIMSTTIEQIAFNTEFSFTSLELFEIIKSIGQLVNERRRTFFGAITDQYLYCDGSTLPVSLRGTALTIEDIESQFASADLSVWFNILHHNGIATVSVSAKGISKKELNSIFSEECLNKNNFAECAFIKSVYFYHNSPSEIPEGIGKILSSIRPIDVMSLYLHYMRSGFKPKYIRWFVESTARNDTLDPQGAEMAEVFEATAFTGPVINDANPACPDLFTWAEIETWQPNSQQFGAAIFKIAIELSFPESLDGAKIYTGEFWRIDAGRQQALFPSNATEKLSEITAEAINRSRVEILEYVVENDGQFMPYHKYTVEDTVIIQPTIWENTEHWGHTMETVITEKANKEINGIWLNNPLPQLSAGISIHRRNYPPTEKFPEIPVLNFTDFFPIKCP